MASAPVPMHTRAVAMNTDDPEAERLEERYQRLHRFLEEEIWSQLPEEELGKPITRDDQEEILGFGTHGV